MSIVRLLGAVAGLAASATVADRAVAERVTLAKARVATVLRRASGRAAAGALLCAGRALGPVILQDGAAARRTVACNLPGLRGWRWGRPGTTRSLTLVRALLAGFAGARRELQGL
eukprot:COSAG01_NODE_27887_length_674_cov_1.224348_1_plen_115_part_00